MKFSWPVVLLFVASVTGCGGGGSETSETSGGQALAHRDPPREARRFRVALNGWEGPETAGLAMAARRGYFGDAGLEVTVRPSPGSSDPIAAVLQGKDDVAIAQEPQVVLARAKGAPIVALAALVERPTDSLIWLKSSGITGIGDLEGRTVAISGRPFQEAFLRSILAREGLAPKDVKIEKAGNHLVGALARGQAEAILGSWDLEPFELEARGLTALLTRVQEHGVPHYDQLVVVAKTARVSEDPQAVAGLVAAIVHGTDEAIEHPGAAVTAIEKSPGSDPGSSAATTKAQFLAVRPFLSASGRLEYRQVSRLVNWMYRQGLIERRLPVSQIFSDQYLKPKP